MRKLLLLLAVLLPQPLKKSIYRALGYRIGKNVRIGLSFIDATHVEIGDNTVIGNFNSFRAINTLRIGQGVFWKNFNEAVGLKNDPNFPSVLIVGDGVQVMSRHYLDVLGTVTLADKALLAGRDTQIWSHSMMMMEESSGLVPLTVHIGRNSYIGARATLVGCTVPDGAIVAAGSVVVKQHPPEPVSILLAGNPASVKKRYAKHPVDAFIESQSAAESRPVPVKQ